MAVETLDTAYSTQRNFHHLVLNATWFGLAMASTSRFLSVYAIHAGATPLHLGLISALPGIAALLTASLGSWWMRHYSTTVKAVFWPALGLRLTFLLLIFTPFLPREWQPVWIILSTTLPALSEGISSVVFVVLMREAVKDHLITSLASRRQVTLNVTLSISMLVFGIWLENTTYPLNYQVMFGVGFIFALMSLWHTMQVKVPPFVRPVALPAQKHERVWRSPRFQMVAAAVLLTHIAYFSIVPVTPLWLYEEFGAGEQFMAFFGLAELSAAALMALFTNRIIARIGSLNTIVLSMLGTALAALILALTPSMNLTLVAAMFTGASWTAAGVGLFGYFNENTPMEEMPRYTGAYTQIVYLAVFIGPLLGSGLANAGVNLVAVLLGGAAVRLLAGVLIQLMMAWRGQKLKTALPAKI